MKKKKKIENAALDWVSGPDDVIAHPLPNVFGVEEEPLTAVSGFRHVEMLPQQRFDPVEKEPFEQPRQQRHL